MPASRKRRAPGPGSRSLLGDLPAIQRDPLGVFSDAAGRYGEVVRFRGGPFTNYLVVHPDDVKRVLQDNHQNYQRGFSYRFLQPVVGLACSPVMATSGAASAGWPSSPSTDSASPRSRRS